MNLRPKSVSLDLDDHWSQVQGLLRTEFDDTAYRTWLAPLDLVGLEGDRVLLAVPTRFLRDWVAAHYADRIRALWRCVNPRVCSIALTVKPASSGRAGGRGGNRRRRCSGRHRRHATPRRNLWTATSAHRSIRASPSTTSSSASPTISPSPPPGGSPASTRRRSIRCSSTAAVGLGKTHLMHAIAWQIRAQNPRRKVVYLSAEKFMYQFIKALRFKDTMSFKELFRSADVLMVDDVQFIGGKESTQEEFFHTFNALADRGRQIVISSDRSPAELSGLEERIRSRLGWGLVADIQPTTYELRLGILQSKAQEFVREARVPDNVLAFLAHRITSNVRELEGALNRVIAQAILVGRAITLEMAQDVLRDLLRAHERRVTIEDIQKLVAEHYRIRIADMHSARRARAVARPRQVAMYLAKQLTPRSLPEIGRKFGGRDHTTVMHAIRKIEELRSTDPVLSEDIEALRRLLQG